MTAAVVSEHSFRWGMHKASQWWHRHTLPFFGTRVNPVGASSHHHFKMAFLLSCFRQFWAGQTYWCEELSFLWSVHQCFVPEGKLSSQIHTFSWVNSTFNDSPFLLGSPLPLLHLFQEEREVHPRKDCTSVQHISSLCAKKLQHCFMEAKQEESIIVTQG